MEDLDYMEAKMPDEMSREEADKVREESGNPGPLAGEDTSTQPEQDPTEPKPGEADVDSAAIGDGPSGGAPADSGGGTSDSSAIGAGGSGGAPASTDTGGGDSSATGAGPSGGA